MTILVHAIVSDGLFPSERVVELKTADGTVQVFVSGSQIDDGQKALRVTKLDEDNDYVLVTLPSLGGGRVAKMSKSEVVSATK